MTAAARLLAVTATWVTFLSGHPGYAVLLALVVVKIAGEDHAPGTPNG